MAPQNSTLINLINDDIKSITSQENMSPITVHELETTLSVAGSNNGSDDSENENEPTEEIPIYINQQPRYISGVTKRTTCNDIIKALIDDELQHANIKFSKLKLICDPQHYTIYERFQDIEHALGGEELIYELWNNWGANRSDVQFRLKINKEFENEMRENEQHQQEQKQQQLQQNNLQYRAKEKKIRKNGIKKLLKKVLQQGELIQKHLQNIQQQQQYTSSHGFDERASENDDEEEDYEIAQCEMSSLPSCSKWNNAMATDTEDELFLVIENHNDNDSGVFITKEQRLFYEMEIDECSTPKRKYRFDRDFESLRDHAINTIQSSENFARTSCKFELIHKEVRSEMNNVKEIINQEHSFLTKINHKRTSSLDIRTNIDNSYAFDNCDNKNETVLL